MTTQKNSPEEMLARAQEIAKKYDPKFRILLTQAAIDGMLVGLEMTKEIFIPKE